MQRAARGHRALVALVAAGLMIPLASGVWAEGGRDKDEGGPGPFSKPSEQTTVGYIWATVPEGARNHQPGWAHGLTLYRLDAVSPRAPFALEPRVGGTTSVCILGNCVRTLDFDVLFYRSTGSGSGSVVAKYSNVGDEEGTVPVDASFAYVFMRTPGTVPDSTRGFGFVYREGEAGSDVLPIAR